MPFENPLQVRPAGAGAVSALTLALLLGAMPLAPAILAAAPAAGAAPAPAPGAATPEAAALAVEIEPLRDRYEVDEPIRFRVRGETPFYVYLYSVDQETGESTLIFPNELAKDNYYPGGRSHLIPDRGAEFYGEKPGTERVVMVASRHALAIPSDQLPRDRPGALKPTEFEGLLSAQGIRVEGGGQARPRDAAANDAVIKRLELEVIGEARPSRAPGNAPTALIGIAREDYRVGETFNVFYGADQDGWMHLYAVEPGGAYERLALEAVRARELKSTELRAEAPYGTHTLIAIYSAGQRLDPAIEARILGTGDRAGTPDDGGLAVTVHSVRVIR